jgi:hypothetical protein
MFSSPVSVANCVTMAAVTGTSRDIERSETIWASAAAARYTKIAMKISNGL